MDLRISLHWVKVLNFIKIMNLSSHAERKWGLESESKLEIEGIHLHHKDMPNLVNYTTNSNGH